MYLGRESNPHPHYWGLDFLTTITFVTLSVCSLDYTFTMSLDLGAPCLVSTRSCLTSFARYYHLKGFTEFTEFYIDNFLSCTQIVLSPARLPISPPRQLSLPTMSKNIPTNQLHFRVQHRTRTCIRSGAVDPQKGFRFDN